MNSMHYWSGSIHMCDSVKKGECLAGCVIDSAGRIHCS